MSREVIWGLLDERASAAWAAPFDHAWERPDRTLKAVRAALAAYDAGARPAAPRATPPRWLAPLVRHLLDGASRVAWRGGEFLDVRELERRGLVTLEPDDTYVLAVVSAGPLALHDDPELRDRVVWRLFEVEGGGEVSLTNYDKFSAKGQVGWQQALLGLVADGTLPRERVLHACLDALRRDFSAYRAGWYQRLYDALDPTPAEQAAAQDDLCALLRSGVPATVTMGVRRLRALSKAGLLDDAATVPALVPALLARAKGTALDALRVLDEVAARGGDVAAVAAEALDSPHADVQRAAVALLTRLGAAHLAAERAASLAPSVAAALPTAETRAARPASPAALPAVTRRVIPVTGDLLDRLAALLEDASDAFEVEAVLAALAVLADPAALRPLRKRAATVLARGPRDGVTTGWLRGHLARLVLVALGEPADAVAVPDGGAFLVGRLREVEHALSTGAPFTPAATPDDGWYVRELRPTTRRYDRAAALLRHAPAAPVDAAVLAETVHGTHGTYGTWRIAVRNGVADPPPDEPSSLPTSVEERWGNELEDWVGWYAMTAPYDTEHFLVHTASSVLAAADATMVRHDAVRVLAALAAHPGRVGPLAYATLAAGLAAKRADQQVHAVDAVLARPLDAALLADGMLTVLPLCTPARWARGLGDLAAAGAGPFVLDVLTAVLPRLPYDLRGLHALVETLREETLRQRGVPAAELRAWLAGFGGGSKAATAARALLAEC